MEEEIYDEAEAGVTTDTSKPITIIGERIAEKPAAPSNKPVIPPANGQSTGMSVKERLALLQAKNNEPAINRGFPLKKVPPSTSKKPSEDSSNNNISKSGFNRPPIAGKPSAAAAISAAIANRSPTVNLQDLQVRKKSLKFVNKRESQVSSADEEDSDIVITKDKDRFRKLPFTKKPGKPAKPASLDAVTLPIVLFTDVSSGVEQRIAAGRANVDKDSFKIKSMTEEDEFEESSKAPALPVAPHPAKAAAGRRGLPPPPQEPVVVDPSIEELYGEGEVDTTVAADGQELYEEFDDIKPPPPTPSRNNLASPQPPPPTASPETARKLTKADKEKEKKEKQKQEKLAKEREKQRVKEAKERDAFLKKYKLSEDEVVTSHYVEAINSASGGKTNLAVKAKEKLQLIRKTGCPDGKWIVRNPNADLIGLVEASNMRDLEEAMTNGTSGIPDVTGDEEIYEELN